MLLVAGLPAAFASAAQPSAPPPAKTDTTARCYLVAIGGMPGNPLYARRYRDWLTRLHAYATGPAGIPKEQVLVLSGDKEFKAPIVGGPATAEGIRQALGAWAGKLRSDDQLVVALVGHGTVTEGVPVLVLPGPDLTARELADALDGVASEHQVVLNFAGAAGDFVKALAKPGRVDVAATNAGEVAEPIFAEFFLQALETKQADGEAPVPAPPAAPNEPEPDPAKPTWRTGAKDGLVSVLEAYNWATHQTAMWIMRQKADGDAWTVEGRQSVELFKKLCVGDGADPAARKLSPKSNASKDDAVIPLRMKEAETIDPWWIGRRTVSEHAVLEDCGQEAAVSALRGQGYEPLDGVKEGQPGFLARRTVIGRAALLPLEATR